MNAETRRAQCNCGLLSVICEGLPQRVSICHCSACKRRTGSAFAWNATFEDAHVTLTGDSKSFERETGTKKNQSLSFLSGMRIGGLLFCRNETRHCIDSCGIVCRCYVSGANSRGFPGAKGEVVYG